MANAPIPIPVTSTTGMLTAAGVWSLVAMALVAAVRGLPKVYELWINRDNVLREGRRVTDASVESRIIALERRAQTAESSLVYVTNALTLALNALEIENAGSPALRQARELVAMAASADDGFGAALGRLAMATGEKK